MLDRLQILIVDDEPMAMRESAQKIGMYIPAENIHCADGAVQMMTVLREISIDLAFIDMELPDTDGFSIVEYIQSVQPNAKYVFLTGHADFAAKSYDYEALDFLTKPVDVTRLKKTFDRFLAQQSAAAPSRERVAIETQAGFVLLSPEDIQYIAKEGRRTMIHCGGQPYAVRYSLDELEQSFEEYGFFRCHQSYLVPLSGISAVSQGDFGKTYSLELAGGKSVPVSRLKYTELRRRLKERGIPFF